MLIAIFGSVKECHRKGLVCSKQKATSKDHKQFITIVITQRRVNQFAGVGGAAFLRFCTLLPLHGKVTRTWPFF
jgi:hypothetical protein